MKTISTPPFSNGTEFMVWEEHNCDLCIKASRYNEKKQGYTKVRCAVQQGIIDSMIGLPISQRSFDALQKWDCPYKKTEWPKRKRKEKVNPNQLTLF